MGNNTSSTQRYQGNDPRQKLKSQVKNLIKELSRIDYSKITSKPRPWSGNLKQLQDFKNYENEFVIFVLSNPTTTIRDPSSSGSRLVCDFLRTAALNNNNESSKEKSSKNKQTLTVGEPKLLEITNGRECHELNRGHREDEIPVSIPNLWFLYESKINLDLDDSLDYENDIQNNQQLDHDKQTSIENLLKPTNPSAFKILTSNSQKIHDSTWRSRQISKFGLANSLKLNSGKSSEIVEFYHFENELLPDFTIVVSPERPSDRYTYVKVYEKIIMSSQMLIVTFSKEDVHSTGGPVVENDVKEAMLFNDKYHKDKRNLFVVITDYFSDNTKLSYGQMNNLRSRGHSTNMFNSVPTTRTDHSTTRMKTQTKRKLLPIDYYTKLCLKIQKIFDNKHSNIDERVFKLGELQYVADMIDDGFKSDDDCLTSVSELRVEQDSNIDRVQLFEEIEGRIESAGSGFSNYMHYVCVINFAPEFRRG